MSHDRVPPDDRPILGSIVGSSRAFLDDVFGSAPWTGRGPDMRCLLDLDDVDRIVASAVRVPAIRMIRDGERVEARLFCSPTRIGNTTLDDVADARKVVDLLRRGTTLVLQSLQRTWSPLSSWCADFEAEVGWPVQANAYLTPADARGLAPHADGHDVFAMQLHGAKRWDVDGLGAIEAQPGDVIYIPADTRHQAHTCEVASLHLTVGVHRPTAARIAGAVAALARERTGFDRTATPAAVIAGLQSALGDIDAAEVTARMRRRPRRHDGGLVASSIMRAATVHTTQIVPIGDWSIADGGERIRLAWDDGVLYLPRRTHTALLALADAPTPLAVGELPGLDPHEQLVLARRLLDERAVRTD